MRLSQSIGKAEKAAFAEIFVYVLGFIKLCAKHGFLLRFTQQIVKKLRQQKLQLHLNSVETAARFTLPTSVLSALRFLKVSIGLGAVSYR